MARLGCDEPADQDWLALCESCARELAEQRQAQTHAAEQQTQRLIWHELPQTRVRARRWRRQSRRARLEFRSANLS